MSWVNVLSSLPQFGEKNSRKSPKILGRNFYFEEPTLWKNPSFQRPELGLLNPSISRRSTRQEHPSGTLSLVHPMLGIDYGHLASWYLLSKKGGLRSSFWWFHAWEESKNGDGPVLWGTRFGEGVDVYPSPREMWLPSKLNQPVVIPGEVFMVPGCLGNMFSV